MEDARPLRPNRYRDLRAGSLRTEDVGRVVRLAGWVAAKRDHGGLLFIDLRDPGGVAPAGVVQLVVHPDRECFSTLDELRLESTVSVVGEVTARPADKFNPKLATGEVEVVVHDVDVLAAAEVLPFPVERDTEVSEELRLRHRYLDMRRGPLVERLALRNRLAQVVRTHLGQRGFLEVQTPVLTASSPEGARDYLVPSRLYPGEFYALPQAPQQFKQLLMVGGVERYFQIAPCFRDEASRADRAPGDFYQIDLEMAYATQDDVFAEIELLFTRIVGELTGKRTEAPFRRLTYAEAVDRYGTDKPDLRFAMEIVDLTGVLGGRTELPMFAEAPSRGAAIRALVAPGAAARPRRWFDDFAERAKRLGATGTWIQVDPGEDAAPRGPLARRLSEEELATAITATGAQPGDALLVTVGAPAVASGALGDVRVALGRELGLADPDVLAFCWIVDFPMFERDPDSGEWGFSHNPFSMPQGGLEALESKDPGDVLAYQYDVVCNGIELSSGAVRNHLPEVMEKAFSIAGYDPETLRRDFPALWGAFHYGPPPHAGIAPGFDRILMILTDQVNLREVIAFPLNQSARDLLMGAPSPATAKQLAELHLRVVPPAP
jgi:aspartyl-tRNA synthetase